MPSSEPSSAAPTGAVSARRDRLIAKGWIQGVALVMLFGFTVMGLLAYRTYTNSMPQPAKVVTANGETLFTTEDITAGQKIFQARGLMEYGSILGHGGYLGQDFTAEYLRMEADSVRDQLAADGVADREMDRARGQLRGAMVLGGEDCLARMGRLGRGEVVTGRLRSMEENLRRLNAVTAEEVRETAAWLAAQRRARVLVGPVG